ncbi:leucyl/phenylalanyl-tRNA--protein transferase [Sulfurospirillum arcachonense]|uniref:leucyl/phenylalanyl-tRNA--protein transferase n=1 Tax=Sulfurospirillum arcachonense TaxID=57666 RepID=UPI0004B15864|nr:leucyl/phenylalanyl-tRNA--protein transferase [Sulfurospirillum arcachonense]
MSLEIPRLLEDEFIFPNPNKAHKEGLLAWGGDLSVNRLMSAYSQGIFPWYSQNDPILWWSPDPRLLLFPKDFKISKSLKKSRKKFTIKYNTNFEEVISTCKRLRKDTWISKEMQEAYISLHVKGYAKSIECYKDEKLVGGLYGVIVGSVFCGESMFSLASDASKVALWELCELMKKHGGDFIDCQMPTDHLLSLGSKKVAREEYLQMLATCKDKKVDFL